MLQKLQQVMHTKIGQIIISILLGFGLASLFRKSCKESECFSFKAPKTSEVENKVYKHGDDCYSFKPETVPCSSESPITFA